MRKSILVILLVLLAVLLSFSAYVAVLFAGNDSRQTCCPYTANTEQNFQSEWVTGRGFGMMGSGRMGPGMMGSMNTFIASEYEFLVQMIPHHEEAVEAALYLRDNTEREEMIKFAEDIIRTQSAEIEQMIIFLETWYPDRNYQVDYQPMMRELKDLQGDALDRAFLEDMIPHHMVAIMISQQLLTQGLAEHGDVALLAGSIRDAQRDEIHMMMDWLANWNSFIPLADTRNWSVLIWVGVLALIVFVVLVILLIFALQAGKLATDSSSNQAQEILKKRYAMGEISREEYLNTQRDLHN